MSIEIKVPALPESIADATIVTWHKKPGDFIKQDENIVDLETDKVVLEVPAPTDGTLKEIMRAAGTTVLAGEVLALFEKGAAPSVAAPAPVAEKTSEPHLTPAVKRAVQENNVEVSQIKGTGKDGKIMKSDVVAAMQPVAAVGAREEQRVPMTRLRKRIAERLMEAKNNTAMLTTFNEVNLQAIMDIRTKYKDVFEKTFDARLGFMSFFT